MKKISEIIFELFNGRKPETESQIRQRMGELQEQVDALLKLPGLDTDGLRELTEKRELISELRAILDARAGWEKLVEKTPIPTAAQIRAVGNEAFFIVPESLVEQLAKLQEKFEAESAAMMAFIPREAVKSFVRNKEAIEAGIVAGKGADVREGWTQADFEQDFYLKLSAHKKAIKRLSVEAHELVRPHVEIFDEAVAEYGEQREAGERSLCELFGLKFVPSPILLLIHKTRLVVRQQFASFHKDSGQAPKQIAGIIIG